MTKDECASYRNNTQKQLAGFKKEPAMSKINEGCNEIAVSKYPSAAEQESNIIELEVLDKTLELVSERERQTVGVDEDQPSTSNLQRSAQVRKITEAGLMSKH